MRSEVWLHYITSRRMVTQFSKVVLSVFSRMLKPQFWTLATNERTDGRTKRCVSLSVRSFVS